MTGTSEVSRWKALLTIVSGLWHDLNEEEITLLHTHTVVYCSCLRHKWPKRHKTYTLIYSFLFSFLFFYTNHNSWAQGRGWFVWWSQICSPINLTCVVRNKLQIEFVAMHTKYLPSYSAFCLFCITLVWQTVSLNSCQWNKLLFSFPCTLSFLFISACEGVNVISYILMPINPHTAYVDLTQTHTRPCLQTASRTQWLHLNKTLKAVFVMPDCQRAPWDAQNDSLSVYLLFTLSPRKPPLPKHLHIVGHRH